MKKRELPKDFNEVYIELGGPACSFTKLKRHFKVGNGTLNRWLDESGIVLNDANTVKSLLSTIPIPSDLHEICKELDDNNNLSIKNIQNHYGMNNPGIVRRWVDKENIIVDARHKKYPLPLDFNDKFNESTIITELAIHYGVSTGIINRWLDEADLAYPTHEPVLTKEELRKLHCEDGLTITEISKKVGCDRHIIANLSYKYDIKNTYSIPLVDKETLIRMHHTEKLTQNEIAERLGIHQTTISNYMADMDISVKRYSGSSAEERQVLNFIQDNYSGLVETQKLWGYEYDIVVPEFKLAIEYCGLRFHSEEFQHPRNKRRHYDKFKMAEDNGYKLITLFADEWYDKPELVKSIILNHLGMTPNKIFARKCQMTEIDSGQANLFYQENHIQGRTSRNIINLGLVHEDELMACMTLGRHPRNNSIVLSRYCTKLNTNVVGGASRLFKHIVDMKEMDVIVSWSDNRWSNGNLYQVLGFTRGSDVDISYDYVTPDKRSRVSKQSMQKDKIGIPQDITEVEYLKEKKYFRIWGCGRKTWEWKRGP